MLKEISPEWIFIGRTDAKVETPILWPPDAKNWLTRKDPDAGKDWGQEEKGMTENEIRRDHWLDGHEFEKALGVGDGQEILACCSPWGLKESDTTEWLNWTDWPHSHKKKKENLPFAATWMDLEGFMLFNEISQTQKDKYYMISLIGGI